MRRNMRKLEQNPMMKPVDENARGKEVVV